MILLLVCIAVVDSSPLSYYTASVFEFLPAGNDQQPISDSVSKNLLTFAMATSLAAEYGSDIIVFPEYGLYPFVSREKFRSVAQFVPDPTKEDWNPCLDPNRYSNTSIVRDLSCMARDNFIFLVSNFITMQMCNTSQICHPDGVFLYNTNVVFDRRGKLVARYHKYHLFTEPGIDVPSKPEFVTFDTDFGKFGTFICFDILWKNSVELLKESNVTSIAFTSWWEDSFPDKFSIQTYYSWSLRFDIHLLAANKNIPGKEAVGSGIFRGSSIFPQYTYNPDGKSKLLLAKVPRPGVKTVTNDFSTIFVAGNNHTGNNLSSGVCSRKILGPPKSDYDYRCLEEDLSNYTFVKLEKKTGRIYACNNGLCCKLYYKVANSSVGENYFLMVNNGYTKLKNYSLRSESCVVARCDSFKGKPCSVFPTKAFTMFNELNITANFSTKYVYPSILTTNIKLLPYGSWDSSNVSLSLLKPMNEALLSASLFGRFYNAL